MKNIILLLLCSFVFVSPLYAAKDTGSKGASASDAAGLRKTESWYRKLLDNERKALGVLKKVKDVTHLKKAAKDLARLKKNMNAIVKSGSSSRSGTRGGLTEAQRQVIIKNAEELEELTEKFNEEIERVQDIYSRVSVVDAQTDSAFTYANNDACVIREAVLDLLSASEGVEDDDDEDEDDAFAASPSRRDADAEEDSSASDKAVERKKLSIITKKYKKIGRDFFCEDDEEFDPDDVKGLLLGQGLCFPAGTWAKYDESTGTLTAALAASEHKYLKELYRKYMKENKRK